MWRHTRSYVCSKSAVHSVWLWVQHFPICFALHKNTPSEKWLAKYYEILPESFCVSPPDSVVSADSFSVCNKKYTNTWFWEATLCGRFSDYSLRVHIYACTTSYASTRTHTHTHTHTHTQSNYGSSQFRNLTPVKLQCQLIKVSANS